jgi:hypothetical protein
MSLTEIHGFATDPRARTPRDFYDVDPQSSMQIVREWVEEWEYEGDEHYYCHHRPHLIALLHALETHPDIADKEGKK